MYHIAILDDERKEAEHIKELADVYFDRKELMQRRIDIFHNGNELLAHVKAIPCDLLFLDIEVGQENGIEIGRKLRQIAPDMIIVVITGYLKYSVEGYKIQAARYLLKPVNAQLLYSELDEVLSLDDRQTLVLEERDTYHRIKRKDILYVETMVRGTRFHTPEGTFESRESLSIWEQRLDAALFVECHKGILVHVRRIVSMEKDTILLETGETLPLARRRVETVKAVWRSFQEKYA